MAGLIAGEAAAWLEGRRAELNRRFELARRRFPQLEAAKALALLAEVLPPLAGPEPAAADLLSAAYDLALLHAARDTHVSNPGIGVLLRETFPALRARLLERPAVLAAALSNAVEHLGAQGLAYARGLVRLANRTAGAAQLLDAGALLAWRLGEARLRRSSLAAAAGLPAPAVLEALGLSGWPARAAPLVLLSLRTDAWQAPAALFQPKTLEKLEALPPVSIQYMTELLSAPPAAPPGGWVELGRLGDFAAFGGAFDVPPVLLEAGDAHVLHVRCGETDLRLDADAFGCVARPCERRAEPVCGRRVPRGAAVAHRASSCRLLEGRLAWTHADSHRVRVLGPRREPL